jgi:hypothetical protein
METFKSNFCKRKNVVNGNILKPSTSIKLKAVFLLIVFSINTLAGFACSVRMDMDFNSKHHNYPEATEALVHIDKEGKKHIGHEKKEKHSHDIPNQHHEATNTEKKGDKGNCCTKTVKQFQDVDKSVPKSLSLVHPVFLTAFVARYYNSSLLAYTDVAKDIKTFVRSYHPPIPDIRVAIQSFQV